jgi:glutaredoxin
VIFQTSECYYCVAARRACFAFYPSLLFYVRLQNSLVDGPKHDTATENLQNGGLCHDLGSHRAIFVS